MREDGVRRAYKANIEGRGEGDHPHPFVSTGT